MMVIARLLQMKIYDRVILSGCNRGYMQACDWLARRLVVNSDKVDWS